MKKLGMGMIVFGVAMVSFGLGYFASHQDFKILQFKNKAAIGIEEKQNIHSVMLGQASKIVYEKEYLRCKHVIISDFEQKNELWGKSLEEIRRIYNTENGFRVSMQGDTLLIHQTIDDWCPEEKNKCRLKEYQGRVAVYKGPDAENDALIKVTAITISSLPAELQEAIKAGRFEFKNEQLLNDALENLDEY
ncbi:MAG: hypothetical protein ABFD08_10660 [Syntrophomonas sp.]